MAGVTSIEVRETAVELEELIQTQSNPNLKERLQVLYLLKLPGAMSVSAVAKVIGRHRGSVQRWLSLYREVGLDGLLETRQSPGRPKVIPDWAVVSLKRRLSDPEGLALVPDDGDAKQIDYYSSRGISHPKKLRPRQTGF